MVVFDNRYAITRELVLIGLGECKMEVERRMKYFEKKGKIPVKNNKTGEIGQPKQI